LRNVKLGRVSENAGKIVWLAGASGMAGSQVLEALLNAPEQIRVIAVTRRPLGRESPRLANRIVPFAQLEAQLRGLTSDTAQCCLGATYRQAGTELAYREAVQTNVMAFARAALAAGAQRFVMLSCHSADTASRSVAARIQGETLDALNVLGFRSLDILLPGPLLGARRGAGVPQLLSMAVASALRPFQVGARERQRAIATTTVAAAMLGAMRSGRRGLYRYEFSGIRSLSRMRGRT
jgi:uncharacterized protein YbjT (DUF2867 family)